MVIDLQVTIQSIGKACYMLDLLLYSLVPSPTSAHHLGLGTRLPYCGLKTLADSLNYDGNIIQTILSFQTLIRPGSCTITSDDHETNTVCT